MKDDGALSCKLKRVEVMGRDISIVSENDNCISGELRSIIGSENKVDTSGEFVRFDLKPGKVFVFDKVTGNRIAVSEVKNNG